MLSIFSGDDACMVWRFRGLIALRCVKIASNTFPDHNNRDESDDEPEYRAILIISQISRRHSAEQRIPLSYLWVTPARATLSCESYSRSAAFQPLATRSKE